MIVISGIVIIEWVHHHRHESSHESSASLQLITILFFFRHETRSQRNAIQHPRHTPPRQVVGQENSVLKLSQEYKVWSVRNKRTDCSAEVVALQECATYQEPDDVSL